MPGGDRTGPAGAGPLTGRRLGYCAGFGAPGYAASSGGYGRGYGRGFGGRGRGWGNWFYDDRPRWGRYFRDYACPEPAVYAQSEREALRDQLQFLQQEVDYVQKRLDDLEKTEQKSDKGEN